MLIVLLAVPVMAQDEETEEEPKKKERPARQAFESAWWFDGQTGEVYQKKTLEFIINHRFGTISAGWFKAAQPNYDFFGMYGPSNIRLGFTYAPINNLNVGTGYTKNKKLWDIYAKYKILQQTRSYSIPLSITYHGNVGIGMQSAVSYQSLRPDNEYKMSDRFSYFNQLIFMRRFGNKFSAQVAPSFTHFNAVLGELEMTDTDTTVNYMDNDTWGVSIGMRYKLTSTMVLMVGWDQPLTQHPINQPKPSFNIGIELNTSAHAFQIFFTNYNGIQPQENYMFNQNDPFKIDDGGVFLLGFNMTRLWSF